MTRRSYLTAAIALSVLVVHPVLSQEVASTSRKILETGPDWVAGVAEPASGRFAVYADDTAIRIFNRREQKTTTVHLSVRTAFGGSISLSQSGDRLVFPVDDEARRVTYIWSLDLDTLSGAPRGEPHRVSVHPSVMASISNDGRWIAFVANDANARGWASGTQLMVMPSEGGEERVLDSARSIRTPRWSPDGRTIYYARQHALAKIPVRGGSPDSIGVAARVVGVSSDGRFVAFVPEGGAAQTSTQIATVNGTLVAWIPFNSENERPYTWGRSGTPGIVSYQRRVPTSLKTIGIMDSRVSNYQVTDPDGVAPRFSPTRSKLALISNIEGVDHLVVFDLGTKKRVVLTTNVRPERYAWAWSPDGSRIAFLTTNQLTSHHELYVADVSTTHSTRVADLGRARPFNASLFRWRSDGNAIDFIYVPLSDDKSAAQLVRVTLAGARSTIRALPAAQQGSGTDGGYRLLSDKVAIVGTKTALSAVPIPNGGPKNLAAHEAYWATWEGRNLLSPNGRWIAIGSVGLKDGVRRPQWAAVSTDGLTYRLLGSPMGCDAFPIEWLPDSRAYLAIGAASCDNWHEDAFIVPVDGSPARQITIPENSGVTVTPDGLALLAAINEPAIGAIVSHDVSSVLASVRTHLERASPSHRR